MREPASTAAQGRATAHRIFYLESLMTDQRNSASPSQRKPSRSLFSARKVALMASVVTGLAVSGFGASSDRFDIFGSVAHAQVSQVISSAAQPTGFADVVERVK